MTKLAKKDKKQNSQPPKEGTCVAPSANLDRKRAGIVLVLTALGITILFSSWIAQNYFKARWLDERLYLEKTQLLIEIETANAQRWQRELNSEAFRIPRNTILYSDAAYNFTRSITTIIAWEEARVAEEEYKATPIIVKNLMHAKAKELFDKRDLNGLLKLASDAGQVQNDFIKELDEKYSLQLNKARDRSSLWDSIFILFYVIGSLLIGTGWILVYIFSWPSKYIRKSDGTTTPSYQPQRNTIDE